VASAAGAGRREADGSSEVGVVPRFRASSGERGAMPANGRARLVFLPRPLAREHHHDHGSHRQRRRDLDRDDRSSRSAQRRRRPDGACPRRCVSRLRRRRRGASRRSHRRGRPLLRRGGPAPGRDRLVVRRPRRRRRFARARPRRRHGRGRADGTDAGRRRRGAPCTPPRSCRPRWPGSSTTA